MKDKKFLIVAKFEFKEIVTKPSFWLTTLFLPILMGVIAFISGYSAEKSVEDMKNLNDSFSVIKVVDDSDILKSEYVLEPFELVEGKESVIEEIESDSSIVLMYIPSDFIQSQKYDIYYQKTDSLLSGVNLQGMCTALINQNGLMQVSDPNLITLLTVQPKSDVYLVEDDTVSKINLGQYVLPIASLVVFFLTVFISSTFMLQSVSTEKENRMIETILSIIDKRSLIIGKMIGLTGVVVVQLLLWLMFGGLIYFVVNSQMNIDIPIDFSQIDLSALPLNIYLIFTAFLFFSAVMIGTGAIGTSATDSKNLSSIFIIMAIFPMYLMQIFISDPTSNLAVFLSYFPFTSHMVLLIRNSLGALPLNELIIGIIVSSLYVVVSIWIAIKMFELGCLMYNRRPSTKEIISALRRS